MQKQKTISVPASTPTHPAVAKALDWFNTHDALTAAHKGLVARHVDLQAEVQKHLDSGDPDAADKISAAENVANAVRRLAEIALSKIKAHETTAEIACGRLRSAIFALREECADEIFKGLYAQLEPFFAGQFNQNDALERLQLKQTLDKVMIKTTAIRAEDERQFNLQSVGDVGVQAWLDRHSKLYIADVVALQNRIKYFQDLNSRGLPPTADVPANCLSVLSTPPRQTKVFDPKYVTPDTPEELRQKYDAAMEDWEALCGRTGGRNPQSLGFRHPNDLPEFAAVKDKGLVSRAIQAATAWIP